MKLRKLLSGVTAAIMAISSVAVASFTSVSATSEFDAYSTVWSTTWPVVESVIAQGNATEEMAGATQAKIYFDMGPNAEWNGATHLLTSYQVGFNSGDVDFGGNASAAAATEWTGVRTFTLDFRTTMEAGQGYQIKGHTGNWSGCSSADNYVFGILWVEFLDKDGKVLYKQDKLGDEPEFGEPPRDQLPLRFVNSDGTDLADPIIFDGDGQYTLEADVNITESTMTGSNYAGWGSFGLYNSYADQVIDPGTTITIDELTLNNEIEIPITDAWKDRSVFSGSEFICNPINHWGSGDQLDSSIPAKTAIKHIKMVFTISNSKLGEYEPPAKLVSEAINKITYEYTVTDPGTAKYIRWDLTAGTGYPAYFGVTPISGAGDYTTDVTLNGEEKLASLGAYIDATANQNDATVDNVTQSKDTDIKVNSITFNDTYKFETTDLVLTNKQTYMNGLANIWNDQGKPLVVTYKNSKGEEVQYTNPDAYLRGYVDLQGNAIVL